MSRKNSRGRKMVWNCRSKPLDTDRGGEEETFQGSRIMMEALEFMGMKAGEKGAKNKKIMFGVLTTDVDESSIPSDEERAALRDQASLSLTNIDKEERMRRRLVGRLFIAGTAFLSAILYFKVGADSLTRFVAVFFPLNLGIGYLKSAESGL